MFPERLFENPASVYHIPFTQRQQLAFSNRAENRNDRPESRFYGYDSEGGGGCAGEGCGRGGEEGSGGGVLETVVFGGVVGFCCGCYGEVVKPSGSLKIELKC